MLNSRCFWVGCLFGSVSIAVTVGVNTVFFRLISLSVSHLAVTMLATLFFGVAIGATAFIFVLNGKITGSTVAYATGGCVGVTASMVLLIFGRAIGLY